MSGESIGMMDKAYFVGKVAILDWFNEFLQVRPAMSVKQTNNIPLILLYSIFETSA